MAEICIKTKSNSYCSASPITDCSCRRDPRFRDPFPRLPRALDQDDLINDLRAVLRRAGGRVPPGKLRIIAQIARLVLLRRVSADGSFVITRLDAGKGRTRKARAG